MAFSKIVTTEITRIGIDVYKRQDVQMPVMDGLEATRRIRSSENPLGKTLPILAMTANAFLEDMQKSKEAGMDEHLSKPCLLYTSS